MKEHVLKCFSQPMDCPVSAAKHKWVPLEIDLPNDHSKRDRSPKYLRDKNGKNNFIFRIQGE